MNMGFFLRDGIEEHTKLQKGHLCPLSRAASCNKAKNHNSSDRDDSRT